MPTSLPLPADMRVLERGWLSANNVLFMSSSGTALVDSGYVTHARQTVALLESALESRPLELLVNTHLHSDHCGGNAALQTRYPDLVTCIPPGHAEQVRHWDAQALTYTPTGQLCDPFRFDRLLQSGTLIQLGERFWQIHAAGGHDPQAIILFEPEQRILISADALWENGFGVVFPELEGESAFAEVGHTLDLIESLQPDVVIPGHGAVFTDTRTALANARQRLAQFVNDPLRHAIYAAKVLLKFKLLELQRTELTVFKQWALQTPYFASLHQLHFQNMVFSTWLDDAIRSLVQSGAARLDGACISNA